MIRYNNIIKIVLICFWFLIGSTGCAYLKYLKDPFVDIPNFHQVNPVRNKAQSPQATAISNGVNKGLYRGGRPNEEGWIRLKEIGIKTVVDLCGKDENATKEKKLMSKLGIDFVNIPLSVYKEPTEQQVLKFLNIVTDKQRQPVFVHCDSGRDRTGAMIAMYRVVVCGWSIKQAYNEAKSLGFWPYHGDAELKRFIHQLKDKKIYFEAVGSQIP